jgi:hypothetical protein
MHNAWKMLAAASILTLAGGVAHAQSAAPNRPYGPRGLRDERPVLPPPQMTVDEKNRLAYAAKAARNIDELETLVATACNVQGWQFSLKQKDEKGVLVTRSQTLPTDKVRCIYYALSFSKYYVATPMSER